MEGKKDLIKKTIIYDKHGLPKTFEIINNRLDYSKVELVGGCGIEIYDDVDNCYKRYVLIILYTIDFGQEIFNFKK